MKTHIDNYVILDAGLTYVVVVRGTKSTHKAKEMISCTWPLFYQQGKQIKGITSKPAIIV